MNFFAHACVAGACAADCPTVFGAMLPDFAHILGFRPPTSCNPRIQAGLQLHHATDVVFHDLPGFKQACRDGRDHLVRVGLAPGPAAASAHVGLELLLDDVLTQDGASVDLFRATLAEATPDGLAAGIRWTQDAGAERFEDLRARLLSTSSSNELAASTVAERISRTLRKRPRLAIRSAQLEVLAEWLESVRADGPTRFRCWFEQVLVTLCERDGRQLTRAVDSLQFRRAWNRNL